MTVHRRWFKQLYSAGLAVLFALTTVPTHAEETITYIHWDAQGSPVAATDEDGNVVWRESYRPYGERINNEAPAGPHTRWYTGHPQDPDTGLVYAGARYYDPVIGRFLAIDPVEFQEDNLHSFNRYAYGNNNPYRYVDPDGRVNVSDPWSRFGGGGGGPGDISHWGGSPKISPSLGGGRGAPVGTGVVSGAGKGSHGAQVSRGVDYSRPSGFRKGVPDSVWNKAVEPSTGRVRDPGTGRFMNRNRPWDMGHRPGYEFRKHQQSARERAISRKQFLDEHNDPSKYRPELPSSNRSHRLENKTGDYFGS